MLVDTDATGANADATGAPDGLLYFILGFHNIFVYFTTNSLRGCYEYKFRESDMDNEPYGPPKAHLVQRDVDIDGDGVPKDEGGENTPSNEKGLQFWDSDEPARTARYNYASEKSLSHADSKLFYQRHQLETSQHELGANGSLTRTRTMPANFGVKVGGLSRATSTASRRSNAKMEQNRRSAIPPGLLNRDGSSSNHELFSSDLNNFDAYGPQLARERLEDLSDSSDSGIKNRSTVIETEGLARGADSSNIAPEMRTICTCIKRVKEIRHKYIGLSLQGPNDNPKDQAGWEIYPPPPEPVWDEVKNRPRSLNSGTNSLSNSKIIPSDTVQSRSSPQNISSSVGGVAEQQVASPLLKKSRKQGRDIGEDFEMSDLLPLPGEEGEFDFKLDGNSVYHVYETRQAVDLESPVLNVPTLREFYRDLEYVINVSSDGPSKSFAFRELDILEGKFNLYFLVNEYEETATCKRVPHRDFYNVRKVDTHVHHSACMNQKHLLRFIKSKMKKSPEEIVMFRDGKHLTLREVFESINLTAYDLSIDTLDMHVRHPLFFWTIFIYLLTFETGPHRLFPSFR